MSVTGQKSFQNGIHICFVVDQVLQHYRMPLFRHLVKCGYNVTICYPSRFKRKSPTLEELYPELSKSVRVISYDPTLLPGFFYYGVKDLNQYDVVICMQNLRLIDFWKATLNPFKQYKLIHWGIGVSSFDNKNWLTTSLRNFSARFADKLILYSEEAIKYYSKKLQNKITVAPNTVENRQSEDFSGSDKDHFLFIGRLDRRKGLQKLIHAFAEYLKDAEPEDIQYLVIIGEGEMVKDLKQKVANLELEKHVTFTGAINEDTRKRQYFKNAQLSVSMNQAGLAVLESFSYGVPFVTSRMAITGGERFNIVHNETGFFVESEQDLIDLMHYSQKNPEELKKIGKNAFQHYQNQRSMEKMAAVFDKAIQEVMDGS